MFPLLVLPKANNDVYLPGDFRTLTENLTKSLDQVADIGKLLAER